MTSRRLAAVCAPVLLFVLAVGAGTTLAHRPVTSKYTFHQNILPLFQFYCGGCHAPGRIAPMSLLTYEEAYPWAESIKEHLLADTMHPWHDDERYATFRHKQRMSPRELNMIVDWAGGGTPEGKGALFTSITEGDQRWQLGEPDQVLNMDHGQSIGAYETERTVNLSLTTGSERTQWLAAFDIRPGNPGILHDVVLYVIPDGYEISSTPSSVVDLPADQILGTWIPGQVRSFSGPDAAYEIPAGARLGVRLHYRKTWRDEGVEATDQSELGLYFMKRKVEQTVRSLVFRKREASAHVRQDTLMVSQPLAREITLRSVLPQMSRMGRSLRIYVEDAQGLRTDLLLVGRFDDAWPIRYEFAEPLVLSRGSRLSISGLYEPMEESSGEHQLAVWMGYTL